jgi:ABC-type transporter Mla subunit MlaD
MTQLQSRNNNTASQIESISEQLASMQQMIAQMQSEMRVLNQQHKAQETLSKEWNNTQKLVTKQFKDACSVYGTPEAIDDMIADLQSVAEEVKENFEEFVESDRFLNQETAEVEDAVEEVSNVIALPSATPSKDDDTTILSTEHITNIISPLSEETLKQLKTMFNVSLKIQKPSSIAPHIQKHNVTHSKLSRLIQNIEGQQMLLSGL